jgi:hypothetical protein
MTESVRSFTWASGIQQYRYCVEVISNRRITYSLDVKYKYLFEDVVLIVSRQLPAIVLKIHNL